MTEQPSPDTPPIEEGYVLRFGELEGPDGGPGRTITFGNVGVRPLGFTELQAAKPNAPLTIPVRLDRATVVDTDIEDLDRTQAFNVNATLQSPMSCRAVSLVKGGWLPPSLAVTSDDTTILLDRNLVPLLVGRSRLAKTADDGDFLDLIRDLPIRINPLLCAMEGEQRQPPSPEQVAREFAQAIARVRAALPKARVSDDPAMLRGALGLLDDSRAHLDAQQRFLVQVAPDLSAPVGRARLPAVWDAILAAAATCGLRSNSLVVLAALSVAAVPKGASPARALLKFHRRFTAADAYNPLADLRALEILMALFALFPRERLHLCTEDRALALFWVGLKASNFERRGSGFAFDLSPGEELLPDETRQWWEASLAGQP